MSDSGAEGLAGYVVDVYLDRRAPRGNGWLTITKVLCLGAGSAGILIKQPKARARFLPWSRIREVERGALADDGMRREYGA